MGKPVVFFDIGCKDKNLVASFYAEIFEWEREAEQEYSVRMNTGVEAGIQGAVTALGHEPHNYVMIYIEVEDIPGYLEKIEAKGGETLIAETEVPGLGHFAWFSDPEGNTIGLWKPAE